MINPDMSTALKNLSDLDEFTVTADAYVYAEVRSRIDKIHANMTAQNGPC